MSSSHSRFVVLDTETTGLDPLKGDRIIEVACLELDQGLYPTDRTYHQYINPQREIGRAAYNVHGIDNEFVKDSPLFADIAPELWDFIKDARLIIHNAEFDVKFLNSEFARLDYPTIHIDQSIDTLKIARKKYPGMANNLDALCKRFSISLEDREKHGALIDVRLLASVYIELTQGGRQQSFLNTEKQNRAEVGNVSSINRRTCEPRTFDYPETENHKDFIKKNFKENLWGY
ncbi:MAG: DNA polymerase III subunit epsilon [Alphaproteobacteria bacterium]|nr:MAG: DNA polymerase III subunit epsilon [Alphaproteobacteria bacterium]